MLFKTDSKGHKHPSISKTYIYILVTNFKEIDNKNELFPYKK